MQGPITWEQLAFFAGLLVVVLGGFASFYRTIGTLRTEILEFKLHVSKEYASVEHIKNVEERLIKSIDSLAKAVDNMPQKIIEILKAASREREP